MSVKVSLPCSMPWSEMEGTSRERHCASCDRSVQNYSLLSPGEREAMVAQARTQRVCAFGLSDGQGRLRTREELSQGALNWLRARTREASAVAALGLAVQPTALAPEALSERAMTKGLALAHAAESLWAAPEGPPGPEQIVAKVRKLEAAQVASLAREEQAALELLLALGGYIDFE